MAIKADENGNNLGTVAIPVTGGIAFAPYGTALPTPEEGGKKEYKLPGTFVKLGLLTKDGGPEWSMEQDGDAIEFWQEGYKIPSGLANVEVKFMLAQTDPTTQEFLRGVKYDENHSMVVDGGGNPNRYAFWVEELFKNGTVRRRAAGNVTIKEVGEAKSERGEVMAYEVTLSFAVDKAHAGGHFREWLINVDAPAAAEHDHGHGPA